ncbi:unnamed protein product [Symbiodinium sp. CCMP2592]|nr:unnamed protein product [Symbiodinium sp. CCMP2592]
MSARLALLTLLGHRILSCASLRHDEEAPKPALPALPALLQRGLDAGNAPQILCGSVKQIGAKYKLHCDQHLQKIREVFKVPSPDEILSSNNIDLDKAEEGTGKSGAKMLFSSDKQYIIKTMSSRDIHALTPVMHTYTMHILNHASTSLMMRFYALMEDGSGQFWIIANNWLPVSFPIVWDLKGSSAGRANGLHDHGQKDNDWRDADKKIALSPEQRDRVLEALQSDSAMLGEANLIDYSLITGLLVYALAPCNGKGQPSCISPVCHPKAGCGETAYKLGDFYNLVPQILCSGGHPKPPALGKSSCTAALTESLEVHVACFGMIDLLKPYDAKSKAEYVVTLGVFGRQVSVQPAEGYAQRFFHFMHDTVFPKKASIGTVALPLDSNVCSAWGSSRNEEEGGFPVITVTVLTLLVAGGVGFGVWYYMNHSPNAESAEPAPADPSQSAYPQSYPSYPQGYEAGYGGYAASEGHDFGIQGPQGPWQGSGPAHSA